ncbi:hypothetical protein MBENS4_0223 [Novosphingobium sp. MBES04]|nr:hypothetical protein MBENS4_0223 [Novosphingobium sp. MBES04]
MGGLAGRGARLEIAVSGGEANADGSRSALLIDESYNANPASMRATLAQLGRTNAKRRIAVLGAMKELGTHGPGYHVALEEPIREAGVDYLVLVGDEMLPLVRELETRADAGENAASSLGKPVASRIARV